MVRPGCLLATLALLLAGCTPQARVDGGDPERGRLLMAQYQCGSCHAAPDVPGVERPLGPSLHGFGRRSYIAGRVPNGPSTLARWLQDPPALVPGTVMPRLGVSALDARDMAAYLLSLE